MIFCRVVVGRPLLQGPPDFWLLLCWLLRHGPAHDLPDEDVGDPWEGVVQFLVGHVIALCHVFRSILI